MPASVSVAGAEQALHAEGVQRVPDLSGPTVAEALKASGSRAFVCANDHVAGLFLQAVQGLGHRVPEEVRIVGIDDVEYASMLNVPLTTVHQPCREIGEAAITTMLTRRERPAMLPRDVLLDCRLVIRKSSGA